MQDKNYIKTFSSEKKRLTPNLHLKSIKELEVLTEQIRETFVGGVNDMERYEDVADSFSKQFEELKDISDKLEQFNIIDEGNLVRDANELAMEYQEVLEEEYNALESAMNEFLKNADALGIDGEEQDAYKNAKEALSKYGVLKFGDFIGWIVEPYMELQSSTYQKLQQLVK